MTLGAWVPTADGSNYVFHAGTSQADGSFVIPGVDRTPYLLQFGTSYHWMNSRVLDLSSLALGRADLTLEPEGTQLELSLQGLSPWQPYADDIQLHSPGAGIGYQAKDRFSGFPEPEENATSLSATFDYPSSFASCGSPASHIEPSKGDVVHLTQNVYRQDTTWAPHRDWMSTRRAAPPRSPCRPPARRCCSVARSCR